MTTNIKHVGKLANTGKRVVVVFRELPDEPDQCLVVDTDALPDWFHDDVINAVESPGAQASPNFYEYAQRTVFTDGTNMLQSLHSTGRLMKTPTDNVSMTPNNSSKVLDEVVSFPTVARFSINSAPVRKEPILAFLPASFMYLAQDSCPIPVASESCPGDCVPISSKVLYPASLNFSAIAGPTPGRSSIFCIFTSLIFMPPYSG